MERLKIVLVIAAIVATTHTSPGQQQPAGSPAQPSASQAQQSYVVIGDVRRFNYYSLSERTTVRQAVLAAGILSDSVNVSVIRAAQDRQLWTQLISSTSADSDELVMNGDILVVQSLLPIAEPVQKNAALRTDAGVIVVALADETIAVGDVLLQTKNPPSPGHQVKISSRFQGSTTRASASLSDRVVHGDVVTISHGNRSGQKNFGNLAPAFSEWQDSAAAAPISNAGQLQNNAAAMLFDEQSFGVQTETPGSLTGTANVSFESVASDTDRIAAAAEPDTRLPLDVKSVSQMMPLPDPDGTVEAPQPPVEQTDFAGADIAAASGTMSPWNFVFIGGLLIAGTLILAGSLRADEETGAVTEMDEHCSKQQLQQPRASVVVSATSTSNTGIRDHADSSIETETSVSLSREHFSPAAGDFANTVTLASEVVIPEVARTNVTPSSLVSPNEWFGRDWLNSPPKSETAQTPICETGAELVVQLMGGEPVQSEPGKTVSASEPPEESPFVMEQQDEKPSDVQVTGFTELEDLLQNRLPIDLCETRLPLRIALFGRPAGPRRLRIDAAHSTFPAPHMNRSAERKRQEPVTVSDVPLAAQEQVDDAFGSLDRALHHLQERTDS